MDSKVLWTPNNEDTNLQKFQKYINVKLKNTTYESLHKWSIENKKYFWSSVWDFTKIIGEKKEPIIENEKDFINSKFFKNCKLNFTENLIQNKNLNSDSIVFYSENNIERRLSWRELKININKISQYFKEKNIKHGDRIAGIMPNIPETVISFLASAKIGAIWSSCSADFGPKAIVDRFKQIKPRILIISDFYYYNNKKFNTLDKIDEILTELTTVEEIIIVPYDGNKKIYNVNFLHKKWYDILDSSIELKKFEKFNFNSPLYILFSSGTTGVPKCIVHGSGGALIQHKKEHQLHCDIKKNDKIFYFTTCGWMMWNWLISCLASNATIFLYDGSPFYPNIDRLFEIIEKEKITFFGTGAKYLDHLKQKNITIKDKYKLNKLRTIASTGSPLVHETFEYVYNKIKKNVQLFSISGGTDIVSCFVLGNPNNKIYSGEIQCKGLGMDVDIFNDLGESIKIKKGELVCKTSFPSKPLYFWNDKNNNKYYNSYFSKFKNIWYQGDYASTTENHGFIIYGRSDATLNAGGVRIGTAELYRVVENIKNIQECIAAELSINNDTKIILFIKTLRNINLDDNFKKFIKERLKNLLSPKHVPSFIIQILDIPKTKSGKIVELTVKKIINNEKIENLNSLINPECLNEYYKIAKSLQRSIK